MSTRIATLCLCLISACATTGAPRRPTPPPGRSVIIFVWDGLRPDAINATDTPNLARLRDGGTELTDNHSTYPTFTMMNSASFATGAFPDATGYFGNVVWQPDAKGSDSAGKAVDYRQPVFSEDYGVLDGLKGAGNQVLLVDTLFAAAQAANLPTVAVGKNGAVYLQDVGRGGMLVDEKTVFPQALAEELQGAGMALPTTTPNAYPAGAIVLAGTNGNPIEFKPLKKLKDGVTSEPGDDSGTQFKGALEYLVTTYTDYVLPKKQPRLTMLWLRDPDTTEHNYGIGTPNWHDALRNNDRLMGRVLAKLDELERRGTTDVIVVSDHGHSNVSGPQSLFPLRSVRDGAVGDVDAGGHSVSGIVRIADLLRRAGFTAFDGLGCTNLPAAMGIKSDGAPVYPEKLDHDGSVCGKDGQKYQVGAFKVPAQLPEHSLVIAVNGGSDYIYVPDHDPALVKKTVAFLQGRAEVGPIFVDGKYGAIPGTMPLGAIHAENAAGKSPDIIFSYDYDENAVLEGASGTEMCGILLGNTYRGMHGSFSPRDVHNMMVAAGPDFRAGFKDPLPSGNVDVAPTVALILGLPLPHAQGRPLLETLVGGAAVEDYKVVAQVLAPGAPATGVTVHLPTDPDGKDVAPGLSQYTFELHTKSLRAGIESFTYFDFAKAVRR